MEYCSQLADSLKITSSLASGLFIVDPGVLNNTVLTIPCL